MGNINSLTFQKKHSYSSSIDSSLTNDKNKNILETKCIYIIEYDKKINVNI